MHCTSCGFENPDGFRFCGNCGLPLPASGAPSLLADEPGRLPIEIRVLPPATSAADDAERRQLTVMFCDLAGSTSLSARLDPEDLRAVVREYQAVCAEAIEANEGYVAQYLGDGVLAYFGYPRGSEREASRAVRAGLAVVRGVRRLGERLEREQGIGLAVRVGIHTGVVVVGEIGAGQRREQLALGETPNLAARLQGLAEADTVVVSGDTQRLVRREFECEDLGEHEVAGIPAPVRLHRVTRDLAAELARPPAASEPIVGRREELAFLRGCWERVCAGRGEVVLVSGEAGIGKSTLMSAFAASLDDEAVVLSARCLPYFRGTAYQPVVELLQHLLGCPASEAPEHKLHCLGGLLERQGLAVAEMMPVFAAVLSLPYDAGEPEGARMPQQRRERTRAALLELLVGAAAQRPLLLRVEDVHWADPSTLELLELLVRQAPGLRVLALFSHRPEFKPPWGRQPHQTPYPLPRLSEAEVEEIIARLTGGRALPPEVVAQIIGRTDGVPLFVEELTKTVLES
ncbi:MAG TPA: AAA family ATPase, partial [Longimicrobiaceae bacterium]|nr:AAA family ATPase [Longimicrobiaceae bacterium]